MSSVRPIVLWAVRALGRRYPTGIPRRRALPAGRLHTAIGRLILPSALSLCLGLGGCADRGVEVSFYTPSQCCRPAPGETTCTEAACPMETLSSIEVTLFRSTGESIASSCIPKPAGACRYEDLAGTELLSGLAPSEGLDLLMEGFVEPSCQGRRHFICDSPGESLVDLQNEFFPVDLWCSCAPIP